MNVNSMKESPMRMQYAPFALALVLFTASCSDERSVLSPSLGPTAGEIAQEVDVALALEIAGARMLRQAPDAPALATYRVSFWVTRDRGGVVEVDYRRTRRQREGDRFLRFEIPDYSVTSWPGMNPYNRRDSVKVTLTIDTVLLSVQFEPSGLTFRSTRPAKLTFWYSNTDPDLNGDGRINDADWQLAEQLAIWQEAGYGDHSRIVEINSQNDWERQYVTGLLEHFSQYGVSW